MIAYLNGNVKFLFADACILDVHGVGYYIFLDAPSRQGLTLGTHAEFFIHTAVADNAINLYGMTERESFELFEMLLTVSGIGAKSALNIVSKISPAEFFGAISSHDLKTLTRLPGVGKKSAERILLELKDKIQPFRAASPAQNANALSEAQAALEALGYTSAEFNAILTDAPHGSSTEQLIRFALTKLNR